ncbi:MAG TPA: hypothetical protein VGY55_04110 [Pirellulales bacterium]|jgi:hypothetical protein|nr:hypothetical protein [Pirellulales bacterium]
MDRWILRGVVIGAILTASPAAAFAQVRAATVVQLPTFRFFAVSTTVEVPDSGGAEFGGFGDGASGRSENGIPGLGFHPFNNAAGGAARGASNMSVSAEIHDFEAADRQLLGGDFNQRADASLMKLPIMLRSAESQGPREQSALATDSAGGQSLGDIRRQQAAEDSAWQEEATRLFDQASALQAAGKTGVAKIYYRMAARRATGSLKERALAALGKLNSSAQSASAEPAAHR